MRVGDRVLGIIEGLACVVSLWSMLSSSDAEQVEKEGEKTTVYTYGNDRISADTIVKPEELTAEELKAEDPAGKELAHKDTWETDYYLYDGRGSVAQVMTEGVVTESYTYDPFGNVTEGAPEFDSFYGYNGEETSPVTGMQYLRARYYDSEEGRFHVADTYLGDISKPLTLNRYTYTVNNPVMHNDPTGHWPEFLDKAVNKVKDGVKSAGKWVKENVVDPVVEKGKKAVAWVKENVVDPVVTTAKKGFQTVKEAAQEALKAVRKAYCDGKEKIGTDNGKKTRNTPNEKPGNPRKQMTEGAKEIMQESGILGFYAGMGDSVLGTIEGLAYVVSLWSMLQSSDPEQVEKAAAELLAIGGSIANFAKDPGAAFTRLQAELQRVADEKGEAYIAGYISGELLQMFLGGAAAKGAKGVTKIDDLADAGKGASKADDLADAAKTNKGKGSRTEKGSSDVNKPYATSRPSYGKDQIEQVWENAKDPETGKVYDPSGVEITWDPTKPRKGQWDMGHIPGEKYSEMHRLYMDDVISKEEFLEWYRDPANYRPELPSTNRSHKYE